MEGKEGGGGIEKKGREEEERRNLTFHEGKGNLRTVDDTRDVSISYQEFSIMYRRVRMDAAGVEPRKLYTLAVWGEEFVPDEHALTLFLQQDFMMSGSRALVLRSDGAVGTIRTEIAKWPWTRLVRQELQSGRDQVVVQGYRRQERDYLLQRVSRSSCLLASLRGERAQQITWRGSMMRWRRSGRMPS
eukprot:767023-Hanusia_phi.AAC.4